MEVMWVESMIIGIIVAVFSSYFSRFGMFLINKMLRAPSVIISKLSLFIWKSKKRLVILSRNSAEVTRHIVRSYALMIVFLMVCMFYFYLVTFGPMKSLGKLPWGVQLLATSPVYIIEALWLIQREYALTLVKVHGRE